MIGEDSDRSRTINLDNLDIPRYDLEALDIPFSEEEVWNTIKNLPSDKAPGPDGFTGKFYKSCWAVIKGDLMAALISWLPCRLFWKKKIQKPLDAKFSIYYINPKEDRG
jgi:hypothetical protein